MRFCFNLLILCLILQSAWSAEEQFAFPNQSLARRPLEDQKILAGPLADTLGSYGVSIGKNLNPQQIFEISIVRSPQRPLFFEDRKSFTDGTSLEIKDRFQFGPSLTHIFLPFQNKYFGIAGRISIFYQKTKYAAYYYKEVCQVWCGFDLKSETVDEFEDDRWIAPISLELAILDRTIFGLHSHFFAGIQSNVWESSPTISIQNTKGETLTPRKMGHFSLRTLIEF